MPCKLGIEGYMRIFSFQVHLIEREIQLDGCIKLLIMNLLFYMERQEVKSVAYPLHQYSLEQIASVNKFDNMLFLYSLPRECWVELQ